jgi:hypothetical protein
VFSEMVELLCTNFPCIILYNTFSRLSLIFALAYKKCITETYLLASALCYVNWISYRSVIICKYLHCMKTPFSYLNETDLILCSTRSKVTPHTCAKTRHRSTCLILTHGLRFHLQGAASNILSCSFRLQHECRNVVQLYLATSWIPYMLQR